MKVHFIAIGGAAMHNLALALHLKGFEVSGSDDAIFDPIMKRLVPGMIDLLVEVDSGKLKLKKKTCFSKFALGCMKAV